jgi:hypothetical protein
MGINKVRVIVFILALYFGASAQETPDVTSKFKEYVVIGFPQITNNQLDAIKTEYLKLPEVISAKYYFGIDNCMLLHMDLSKKGKTTFYDLLKVTNQIYPMDSCYTKPGEAYAEIELNELNAPITIIK